MKDKSWLSRSQLLIGEKNIDKLAASHVLVIGLGGVGSFAAEFIARAGVGEMTIIDGDIVDPTNRNRQLPALATTHGLSKAVLMHDRLMQINPELKLNTIREFVTPERVATIMEQPYDYVIEAIDSITPKVTVIASALRMNLKIVSSMGAGGKMDPTKLEVADISKTDICKLARYVRLRLRNEGFKTGVKAVFSREPVNKESLLMTDGSNFKKSAYGTISYLPATFGAVCASVVIRDLTEEYN
jgi:tRNA A37 threonylcarbamoyladenosine dehydratase